MMNLKRERKEINKEKDCEQKVRLFYTIKQTKKTSKQSQFIE